MLAAVLYEITFDSWWLLLLEATAVVVVFLAIGIGIRRGKRRRQ